MYILLTEQSFDLRFQIYCFRHVDAVVCCLTSMAIETLHHREIIPSKHWFRLDGNAIGSGRDCEQEDLHSAAINGILSGLVSITAGERLELPGENARGE